MARVGIGGVAGARIDEFFEDQDVAHIEVVEQPSATVGKPAILQSDRRRSLGKAALGPVPGVEGNPVVRLVEAIPGGFHQFVGKDLLEAAAVVPTQQCSAQGIGGPVPANRGVGTGNRGGQTVIGHGDRQQPLQDRDQALGFDVRPERGSQIRQKIFG